MATRIVDLELTEPLPAAVDPAGCDRYLLVLWRRGVPVATIGLKGNGGTLTAPELASAVADSYSSAEGESNPCAAAKDLPTATAVVCTFRRPAELRRCLEALHAQDHPSFDILVVDNSPERSAAPLVRESFPGCGYASEPRPGVRFARNLGVAEARGEVVAFIDDDCLPVRGWLRAIAGNFRDRPRMGCCTGPVLPSVLDTPAQELMERRGGFNRGFAKQVFTAESGAATWPAWPLQAWMFGSGGNMAFRRSVLRQIGGFDAVLRTAEDLDIFFRVLRAGFELAYEPGAAVRHRHVTDRRALRRRLYLWGWGYLAYLTKVVCDDPVYRRRALAEGVAWLCSYQIGERLAGRLRGREAFPLGLILAEIAGGIAAVPGYLWDRFLGSAFAGQRTRNLKLETRN